MTSWVRSWWPWGGASASSSSISSPKPTPSKTLSGAPTMNGGSNTKGSVARRLRVSLSHSVLDTVCRLKCSNELTLQKSFWIVFTLMLGTTLASFYLLLTYEGVDGRTTLWILTTIFLAIVAALLLSFCLVLIIQLFLIARDVVFFRCMVSRLSTFEKSALLMAVKGKPEPVYMLELDEDAPSMWRDEVYKSKTQNTELRLPTVDEGGLPSSNNYPPNASSHPSDPVVTHEQSPSAITPGVTPADTHGQSRVNSHEGGYLGAATPSHLDTPQPQTMEMLAMSSEKSSSPADQSGGVSDDPKSGGKRSLVPSTLPNLAVPSLDYAGHPSASLGERIEVNYGKLSRDATTPMDDMDDMDSPDGADAVQGFANTDRLSVSKPRSRGSSYGTGGFHSGSEESASTAGGPRSGAYSSRRTGFAQQSHGSDDSSGTLSTTMDSGDHLIMVSDDDQDRHIRDKHMSDDDESNENDSRDSDSTTDGEGGTLRNGRQTTVVVPDEVVAHRSHGMSSIKDGSTSPVSQSMEPSRSYSRSGVSAPPRKGTGTGSLSRKVPPPPMKTSRPPSPSGSKSLTVGGRSVSGLTIGTKQRPNGSTQAHRGSATPLSPLADTQTAVESTTKDRPTDEVESGSGGGGFPELSDFGAGKRERKETRTPPAQSVSGSNLTALGYMSAADGSGEEEDSLTAANGKEPQSPDTRIELDSMNHHYEPEQVRRVLMDRATNGSGSSGIGSGSRSSLGESDVLLKKPATPAACLEDEALDDIETEVRSNYSAPVPRDRQSRGSQASSGRSRAESDDFVAESSPDPNSQQYYYDDRNQPNNTLMVPSVEVSPDSPETDHSGMYNNAVFSPSMPNDLTVGEEYTWNGIEKYMWTEDQGFVLTGYCDGLNWKEIPYWEDEFEDPEEREAHRKLWQNYPILCCVWCYKCWPQYTMNRWYFLENTCGLFLVLLFLMFVGLFVLVNTFVAFNPMFSGTFELIYETEDYSKTDPIINDFDEANEPTDDSILSTQSGVSSVLVSVRNWEQTYQYKLGRLLSDGKNDRLYYWRPETVSDLSNIFTEELSKLTDKGVPWRVRVMGSGKASALVYDKQDKSALIDLRDFKVDLSTFDTLDDDSAQKQFVVLDTDRIILRNSTMHCIDSKLLYNLESDGSNQDESILTTTESPSTTDPSSLMFTSTLDSLKEKNQVWSKVMKVRGCRGTVIVSAGVKVLQISRDLIKKGLELRGVAGYTQDMTVGGALGTCSFGLLNGGKPLGFYMRSVWVMNANGESRHYTMEQGLDPLLSYSETFNGKVEITNTTNIEEDAVTEETFSVYQFLSAFRCNLGLLGTVYQVELEVFPREIVRRIPVTSSGMDGNNIGQSVETVIGQEFTSAARFSNPNATFEGWISEEYSSEGMSNDMAMDNNGTGMNDNNVSVWDLGIGTEFLLDVYSSRDLYYVYQLQDLYELVNGTDEDSLIKDTRVAKTNPASRSIVRPLQNYIFNSIGCLNPGLFAETTSNSVIRAVQGQNPSKSSGNNNNDDGINDGDLDSRVHSDNFDKRSDYYSFSSWNALGNEYYKRQHAYLLPKQNCSMATHDLYWTMRKYRDQIGFYPIRVSFIRSTDHYYSDDRDNDDRIDLNDGSGTDPFQYNLFDDDFLPDFQANNLYVSKLSLQRGSFLGYDSLPMQDSCVIWIEFMPCTLRSVGFIKDSEEIVSKYGGTQHWSHLYFSRVSNLVEKYYDSDKLLEFEKIRTFLDPDTRFVNGFYAEVFDLEFRVNITTEVEPSSTTEFPMDDDDDLMGSSTTTDGPNSDVNALSSLGWTMQSDLQSEDDTDQDGNGVSVMSDDHSSFHSFQFNSGSTTLTPGMDESTTTMMMDDDGDDDSGGDGSDDDDDSGTDDGDEGDTITTGFNSQSDQSLESSLIVHFYPDNLRSLRVTVNCLYIYLLIVLVMYFVAVYYHYLPFSVFRFVHKALIYAMKTEQIFVYKRQRLKAERRIMDMLREPVKEQAQSFVSNGAVTPQVRASVTQPTPVETEDGSPNSPDIGTYGNSGGYTTPQMALTPPVNPEMTPDSQLSDDSGDNANSSKGCCCNNSGCTEDELDLTLESIHCCFHYACCMHLCCPVPDTIFDVSTITGIALAVDNPITKQKHHQRNKQNQTAAQSCRENMERSYDSCMDFLYSVFCECSCNDDADQHPSSRGSRNNNHNHNNEEGEEGGQHHMFHAVSAAAPELAQLQPMMDDMLPSLERVMSGQSFRDHLSTMNTGLQNRAQLLKNLSVSMDSSQPRTGELSFVAITAGTINHTGSDLPPAAVFDEEPFSSSEDPEEFLNSSAQPTLRVGSSLTQEDAERQNEILHKEEAKAMKAMEEMERRVLRDQEVHALDTLHKLEKQLTGISEHESEIDAFAGRHSLTLTSGSPLLLSSAGTTSAGALSSLPPPTNVSRNNSSMMGGSQVTPTLEVINAYNNPNNSDGEAMISDFELEGATTPPMNEDDLLDDDDSDEDERRKREAEPLTPEIDLMEQRSHLRQLTNEISEITQHQLRQKSHQSNTSLNSERLIELVANANNDIPGTLSNMSSNHAASKSDANGNGTSLNDHSTNHNNTSHDSDIDGDSSSENYLTLNQLRHKFMLKNQNSLDRSTPTYAIGPHLYDEKNSYGIESTDNDFVYVRASFAQYLLFWFELYSMRDGIPYLWSLAVTDQYILRKELMKNGDIDWTKIHPKHCLLFAFIVLSLLMLIVAAVHSSFAIVASFED